MHETELIEQTETGCSDDAQSSLNYPEGSSHFHMPIPSDDEINSKIRSLNLKQQQIFDFIYNWAKLHVKSLEQQKSNQRHFICFSREVGAVVNHT